MVCLGRIIESFNSLLKGLGPQMTLEIISVPASMKADLIRYRNIMHTHVYTCTIHLLMIRMLAWKKYQVVN